jgi:tetratricopeptide (TPR) repeat protein
MNPPYSKAWNNKGVAPLMQGIYEVAITCFDKSILLNPTQRDTALVNRNLAVEKNRYTDTNKVKLNLRIH